MHASILGRIALAAMAPAFNPGPDRGIAVLVKTIVIHRRLIARDLRHPKTSSFKYLLYSDLYSITEYSYPSCDKIEAAGHDIVDAFLKVREGEKEKSEENEGEIRHKCEFH